MSSIWLLTLSETTWDGSDYDIQLYKTLEGVHYFLQQNWKSWRYRADMDEGFGPHCPTLESLRKRTESDVSFNPIDTEIVVADLGGDYHYSLLIKIQYKYIND